MMPFRILLLALTFICWTAQATTTSHGFSVFGQLKYPKDFTHFDYANPQAPQGGTLKLSSIGTYDSLNPFILKGISAANASLPFESLMTGSGDELEAYYGLIAESVEHPTDYSWMIFTLRKEARWHDNTPITAKDVQFSYDILKSEGTPSYRILLRDIERPEILSENKIRFVFINRLNRDLPSLVASMPILSKAYYDTHDFAKTTLEPPMASGPYKISQIDPGKSLAFDRVEDYWGKDLAVNQGITNFDRIIIDYYRDRHVAFEAFKAGEYDIRQEFTSKRWATEYNFPAIEDGRVVTEIIPDTQLTGIQATFFNTRRAKFQDRAVRKALTLVFDFEWLNKSVFYSLYQRINSVYEPSTFAATGVPSAEERALLEPFRSQLPEEVFTTPFKLPVNDGTGRIRNRLREAMALLKAAGWHIHEGVLQNQQGEPFTIEFLLYEPTMTKIYQSYVNNLQKLGIQASLRVVDVNQYQNRMEAYDYDMLALRPAQPSVPGLEQRRYWGSEEADIPGGSNISGIKNPAIDALLDQLIASRDLKTITHIARCIDRILMWNYYFIPAWYYPYHNIAYWNKFSRPKVDAPYYSMVGQSAGNPIGSSLLWWYDKEKAAKLKQ